MVNEKARLIAQMAAAIAGGCCSDPNITEINTNWVVSEAEKICDEVEKEHGPIFIQENANG